MKPVNRPKDYSTPVLIICAFLAVIFMILSVVTTAGYFRLKEQLQYTKGRAIDLPEEFSTIGKEPVTLEAFTRNDTTFIQFPNN